VAAEPGAASLIHQQQETSTMGVNSITLVGRAGRDPEVRYFESGSVVANLTLAVNRRSRDEEPDWFNLEIWGKQAQVAADYVRKGALVGIIGSFKLDRWTDRASGEERTKPVIRVDRLELLGSKRDAEGGGGMGGQNMTAQTQQLLQMNMMRSTMANQATIQQSRMVGDVQQNIRNQFAYQAAVKKAIQQANNQRKTEERNSESLGFVGAPPGLGN
jgi:single-strand DNA-binding protein